MSGSEPFLAILVAGASRCLGVLEGDGGPIAALFVAGLVGGVSHCAGMCGPFVLSQTAARLAAAPAGGHAALYRLGGVALLPYHAGRLATYSALGAAAAGLGDRLTTVSGLSWLPAVFLVFAGISFLGAAFSPIRQVLPLPGGHVLSRIVAPLARPLLAQPFGLRGVLLGIALGFLPCGLLYGALALAATTGDPILGAAGMALFGIGTAPSLVAVALGGYALGHRYRSSLVRVAPVALAANAAVLFWFAWGHVT